MIENSKRTIDSEINEAINMIKRREKVKCIYNEMVKKGFDFINDPGSVMREIMKNFHRKESSMIFKDLKSITF